MSKPEGRGPGRAPLHATRVNAFFHHLGRTGSVTVAANRAQLRRSALYERRQNDEAFAERWARALDLGVERLQDNAMNCAMNGTEKRAWRNGQKVGSIRQFDNRLLQFLLKDHRPDLYGDRPRRGAAGRTGNEGGCRGLKSARRRGAPSGRPGKTGRQSRRRE